MDKVKFKDESINVSNEEILKLISNKAIMPFLEQNLSLIDSFVFPEFPNHDIKHSCKVALFSLIMATYFYLDNNSKKILVDAAFLHDVGRIDDYYDYDHSYLGASLVDEVLKNQPFYQNIDNLNLVRALIFGHNKTPYDNLPFIKYNVLNNDKNILLLKILKDADVLDLLRKKEIMFNENNLYLNISKSLINFSKFIQESNIIEEMIERGERDDRRNSKRFN